MHVTIQSPMWLGGKDNEKVGIAEKHLVGEGTLTVEIAYKDGYGNKKYPHTYTMSNEKARGYHLRARDGKVPPLYLIPIKDFDIAEPSKPIILKEGEVLVNGEVYRIVK